VCSGYVQGRKEREKLRELERACGRESPKAWRRGVRKMLET